MKPRALHAECRNLLQEYWQDRHKDIKGIAEEMREKWFGVCLDCLKAGGKFEGECRFQHET